MATVLDVGLIQYFSVIFPVILVFAIVFAGLQKSKLVGESPAINALIAIVAGLLMLLSNKAVLIINNMIPWFAVAIIFFIMLLFLLKMFGLKDESLITAVKDKAVYWSLIGIALAIVGAAVGTTFGQEALDTGTTGTTVIDSSTTGDNFQGNIYSIMSNSKVLGMMIIFAIAIFTIALLTGISGTIDKGF